MQATIDEGLLESLSFFEDQATRVRESFMSPSLGGDPTLAVLAEPLGESAPMAWVLCHSYGLEQIYLQTVEVPLARAVAVAGWPILRYHGQGYGDSTRGAESVTLASHVRDAIDAADAVRRATGKAEIGLIGARLGGSVAALAAEAVGASALALWNPVVEGSRYVGGLVRQASVSQASLRGNAVDPVELIKAGEAVDLQGFPLSTEAYRQMAALDLTTDVQSFSGRSLILQISRTDPADPALARLHEHLTSIGSSSVHRIVTDASAARFGGPRYRPRGDGTKVDALGGLVHKVIDATTTWLAEDWRRS